MNTHLDVGKRKQNHYPEVQNIHFLSVKKVQQLNLISY